jgi:peptide/nickel transport system substrate-binding protein
MSAAPIGSGPYRAVRVSPGQIYELERFDAYMANSPKGPGKIRRIQLRMIPDGSTQLSELMAGGIDWVWRVPNDNLKQINTGPGLKAEAAETMRIAYVSLDSAGRSGTKPLQDIRVRQAIAHAVNWDKIAKTLVAPVARGIAAPCFPSQFGCDESKAVAYKYDVAKAKQLMNEAGYANGFAVDFFGVRDRSLTEAIAGELTQIGIKARVQQLQAAAMIEKTWAGQAPMYLWDVGSYSINDVSALMPIFFGESPENYSQDPDVIGWIKTAGESADPEKRKELYGKAIERITARAYWLPAFTIAATYAYSDKLNFKAYTDELPRFNLYGWK